MATTRAIRVAAAAVLSLALLSAGCASSARRSGLNSRLIRPPQRGSSSTPAPYDVGAPPDSFETVIGKIRELSTRARPARKTVSGPTIESVDGRLSSALLALTVAPGAAAQVLVAREYARLGIFDEAHKHYRAALALAPSDAAAYDGLARLWREAGLPALALGDAQRAVYFAPRSPEARNTLGTVFQSLGRLPDARTAYETALVLQPRAAYALNNLGYLALVQGDTPEAIRYCREAIAADATLRAARHNLALAYAAADRMDLARQALLDAGPPARADYNLGIISLARGNLTEAAANFDAACRIDPAESRACARAGALRARAPATRGGTP